MSSLVSSSIILGMAVSTMVWSSAEKNMPSVNPTINMLRLRTVVIATFLLL